MQTIKKICVDSRFANSQSISHTDFKMDLTDSVQLPDNTAVVITDICIPHSWYSIEYYSENFYFRLVEPDEVDENVVFIYDHKIQLSQRNYDIDTLKNELITRMNAAVGSPALFSGSSDLNTARITVSLSDPKYKFYIFSDKDLRTQVNGTWRGAPYDGFRPHSCNSVVGFEGSYNFADPYTSTKPWVSGVVDTLGIHNIYITSPQFGYNSFGPRGERSILKKVLVNVSFGGVIADNWINQQDFTDCSKRLLRSLEFRLTDAYGNTLELHGAHVSFTLIFVNN